MKWFLVAVMTVIYSGDEKDVYIWSNPSFGSSADCMQFVAKNRREVDRHLREEFPGDTMNRLLCVQEDRLRQFLTDAHSNSEQGESI